MRFCTCVASTVVFVLLASGAAIADDPATPVSPPGPLQLFNGKDLTGLRTWLKEGKREDPRQVFRVHDGVLHISGEGNGYAATERAYRDYHLVVEYRWGDRTDGGRSGRSAVEEIADIRAPASLKCRCAERETITRGGIGRGSTMLRPARWTPPDANAADR